MTNRSLGKRPLKIASPFCLVEDFREFLDVDNYFPDELSLADYAFANYLTNFSEEKGFKTYFDGQYKLLGFLKHGIRSFKRIY